MDVMSAAWQGLQHAEARVEQTAGRLARIGTQSVDGMPTDTVDLGQEMVALLAASNDFRTNLAVLKTGDEMARQVVDLLA